MTVPHREQTRRAITEASAANVLEGRLLKDYTSFGIGGPAAFFAEARTTDELSRLLAAAHRKGLPVLVLGGGTNLLISDEGFDGLAVRLALFTLELNHEPGQVRVGAAVESARFVEATIAASLAGTAFAAGLPGTVGGAIAGNAGCFGGCFGDLLAAATVVLPDGQIQEIDQPAWFGFDYRHSRLLGSGAVLTLARFTLPHGDQTILRATADSHIATRRDKHPLPGVKTAGSYFKNLPPAKPGAPRTAAGALLDQVGARELRIGDAAVFEKHANIIINRAHATAKDVLALADELRQRVARRFGIALVPEVRFVGEPILDRKA